MSAAQDEHLNSLIRGCLQEDRHSQEMLYRHFYGYGMSICLRYSTKEEEAIEVLNDSFLKVFQKIDTYDTTKPFRAWFRRILINTSINNFKKNWKHHNNHQQIEEAYHLGIESKILSQLSYQEIIKLVQELSPSYRTIFNLFVIDGYTHEEIAELLHISVGASKSGLSRAREKLKLMLKKNHKEIYERYE